jgi:hypothetical protein
MVATWDLH